MTDKLSLNLDNAEVSASGVMSREASQLQEECVESQDSAEFEEQIHCAFIGSLDAGEDTYIGKKVEAGDSEPPIIDLTDTGRSYDRPGWQYAPRACRFEDYKKEAAAFLAIAPDKTLQEWVEDNLVGYREPFRSNLHGFLVDLWSFDLSAKQPVITARVLLQLSLSSGPSFAKDLDQYRAATIGLVNRVGYLSTEISEIFKVYRQPDVNPLSFSLDDLYRPNKLFNWSAPELSLFETSYEPVLIEEKYLDEFRRAIRLVLSNKKLDIFEEIPWEEIENDTSKSCLEGKVYEQKRASPALYRGVSRLTQVPRELKEKRLACVEEYSSGLRIRWIESNVQRILTADRRSKMKLEPKTIKFELQRALRPAKAWQKHSAGKGYYKKEDPWTYCRDFKKEGLTKPRIILRVMLEELHARFPYAKCFESVDFYDVWEPVDAQGIKYYPPRGHGLGMASALTTLMQIGIEEINLAYTGIVPTYSGYYNDDAAIAFKERAEVLAYSELDKRTCRRLSLQFKTKASFVAKGYIVLCEQYASEVVRGINNKAVYYIQEFANLLKSVNAAHARHQASCMNIVSIPKNVMEYVLNYWGYVFFRNEQQQSSLLGGWWRQVDHGVDMSFFDKNPESEVPVEIIAALGALKEVKKEVLPWMDPKYSKKKKLAKHYRKCLNDFNPEFARIMEMDKPLTKISMFRPSMNGTEETRSWRAYQKALRAAYRSHYRKSTGENYGDLADKIREDNNKMDILPPWSDSEYIRCKTQMYYNDFEFRHPYQGHGARLDHETFVHGYRLNEYILRSTNGSAITVGYPKLSSEVRSTEDAANYIKFKTKGGSLPGLKPKYYHVALVPDERVMPYWHNPFHVAAVTDKWYRNRFAAPIPKRFKNAELLGLRDKVYSRALFLDEWYEIGTVHPKDQRLLQMVMTPSWNTELIKEFCQDLRKYPGLGAFLNFVRCPDMLENNPLLLKWNQWVSAHLSRGIEEPFQPDPIVRENDLLEEGALERIEFGCPEEYAYDEFAENPVVLNDTLEEDRIGLHLDEYSYDDELPTDVHLSFIEADEHELYEGFNVFVFE